MKNSLNDNFGNFNLIDKLLTKVANNQFTTHRYSKEWKIAISLAILFDIVAVTLSIYAGYFYLSTLLIPMLESAYFAYTIYGVAITPALLAALVWKRTTKAAGVVSIVSATIITVFLKLAGYIWPSIMVPRGNPNGDPFGIPIIYPALAISVLSLVIVSYLTKPPSKEVLSKFFPDEK